jgi:hypothetical protein
MALCRQLHQHCCGNTHELSTAPDVGMEMNHKNLHVSLAIKAVSRAQESHPKYSNAAKCSQVTQVVKVNRILQERLFTLFISSDQKRVQFCY